MNNSPEGLDASGLELWDSVAAEFDLDHREMIELEEACRVRDTIAVLRAQLAQDGTMIASSQGSRLHPVIAEIRSQQLTLARLLATLKMPALEDDDLPASTGARGVYALATRKKVG